MLASEIQKDLLDFINLDPKEIDGLIEFWYMDNSKALSTAIRNERGLKFAVNVRDYIAFEEQVKKIYFLADLIVLKHFNKWFVKPNYDDDLWIPETETVRKYKASIGELLDQLPPAQLVYLPHFQAHISSGLATLNGHPAACCGWTKDIIPKHFKVWVAGNGKNFLKTGRIVFAPFIPNQSMEFELLKSEISVPDHYGYQHCYFQDIKRIKTVKPHLELPFKIPHLGNIDIDTLHSIKEEIQDDISIVTNSLCEITNRLKTESVDSSFHNETKYIKTNFLDPLIVWFGERLKKISSMRALQKQGSEIRYIKLTGQVLANYPSLRVASALTKSELLAIEKMVKDLRANGESKVNKHYFFWRID